MPAYHRWPMELDSSLLEMPIETVSLVAGKLMAYSAMQSAMGLGGGQRWGLFGWFAASICFDEETSREVTSGNGQVAGAI